MKKNLTEIVVVLDESGSMSHGKDDTMGGFNEFISTQKKLPGEVNFTFVKFSDYYKIINDGVSINHVAALNESNFTPSNSTALLDAVGKTINNIGNRLSNTDENLKPEKVLFVVITDGQENSSKEFTRANIFEMVKHQKEKYQWEFLFMGADVDAWGGEIGINSNVRYSKGDSSRSYKGLSHFTAMYRSAGGQTVDSFQLDEQELDTKLADLTKK
jgi:uncharacterized protein YegL